MRLSTFVYERFGRHIMKFLPPMIHNLFALPAVLQKPYPQLFYSPSTYGNLTTACVASLPTFLLSVKSSLNPERIAQTTEHDTNQFS